MKRYIHVGLTIASVIFAIWAYNTSGKTRAADIELAKLDRQIMEEKEAIAILEAEWAYLNRPERLRHLVKMNEGRLHLVSINSESYGEIKMAPYPALELVSELPEIDMLKLDQAIINIDQMEIEVTQ